MPFLQPGDIVADAGAAGRNAPASFINLGRPAGQRGRVVRKQRRVVPQTAWTALPGRYVISILRRRLPGKLALAVPGVGGSHLARQSRHRQQPGRRRNRVGRRGNGQLSQHRSPLGGPRADRMPRRASRGPVVRAPPGFAVHRYRARTRIAFRKAPPEPQQPLPEGVRSRHPRRSGKGVVAGNAVFRFQEILPKIPFGLPEECHVGAGLAAAEHGAPRDMTLIRCWRRRVREGMTPVIPLKRSRREPQDYDADLYQARHLVENEFGKFKEWRGGATRYAKNAASYLAICQMRALALWAKIV